MKKFIFLIPFLFVCSFAQAGSLAEVLAWKYGHCADTKQKDPTDMGVNPKMVISAWRCAEPQPTEAEIETFTTEYLASQDYWASRFDVVEFTHDLGLAFTGLEAISLAPYLGAYQSYAEAKNFLGIKDFTNGLVLTGKATEGQAQAIKDIFLTQGVNLDLWE